MHLKKINKNIRYKIISGLVILLSILGIFVGYKYQQNTINDLKCQLRIKQMQDSRLGDSCTTTIDTKSIETEFNKLCDYKIFCGRINVQHKYNYNRDFILGLKKNGVLVGTCDVYYEYYVRLADADIELNGDKLTITLPKPQLNDNSIHRVANTLIFTEESKNNVFMNDKDGVQLMRSFEDSLDIKSIEDIKKYYSLEDKQKELESYAKQEIKNLLCTLGYNKLDINIQFG